MSLNQSADFLSSTKPGDQALDVVDKSIHLSLCYFIISGLAWLLIGSVLGVVGGMKMVDPSFLASFEFLTYGRVQAALNSSLMMGWVSNIVFAIALWIMARLSAAPVSHGGVLLIAGVIWNVGLSIGLLGIFIGDMTSLTWLDLPSYTSGIFLLSYSLIAVWGLVTFSNRNNNYSFVSQWYIIGALLWFPWVYVIAQFFLFWFPVRGVTQSIIHAWYVNSIFYLWIAPIGLAAAYYLIPKILRVPIRAYHMSSLAFWSFVFFSSWSGLFSLIGAPVPVWLVTVSIVSSISLLIPIIIYSYSILGTLISKISEVLKDASLIFIAFGCFAFIEQLIIKVLISIRAVDTFTHFTLIYEGFDWHLIYAFFSMVAFGVLYHLIPQLLKQEWASGLLVKLHFILSALGVSLLVLALYIGGWVQGMQFSQPEVSFLAIATDLKFWMQLKFASLIMLLLANSIFVLNILATVAQRLLSVLPIISTLKSNRAD